MRHAFHMRATQANIDANRDARLAKKEMLLMCAENVIDNATLVSQEYVDNKKKRKNIIYL